MEKVTPLVISGFVDDEGKCHIAWHYKPKSKPIIEIKIFPFHCEVYKVMELMEEISEEFPEYIIRK
jgi:hypothetical protein